MMTRFTLLVGLLGLAGPALAQEEPCGGPDHHPCTMGIDKLTLQRGPAVFRFQARISQAKLPAGSGVFKQIGVKLLRGTEILCSETIPKVEVREGVLNLEIGRGMNCAMEEVIAENTGLSFQVCLGGEGSCLAPVALGSVPYAVKTTFARTARAAGSAQVAGRAEWAHRLTADADLFAAKQLGAGYFDFYTHAAPGAAALYDAEGYAPFKGGGFMQWTPTTAGARTLNFVARDHDTGALGQLNAMVLASKATTANGDLVISPATDGLALSISGNAAIVGNSDFGGLAVARPVTITAGGLTVFAGGLTVSGDTTIAGKLSVSMGVTSQSGGLTDTGRLGVAGNFDAGGALIVEAGGVTVDGASSVTGDFDVTEDAAMGGTLTVTGTTLITGPVTFEQGFTTSNGADLRYVQYAADTRALTLAGAVTFQGGLTLASNANLAGNHLVGGRFEVAAAAPVICDGTHQGYVYLDSTQSAVMVCVGTSFKPIAMTVCGDNKVELGEDCDDGDTDPADGCSAACQVESGFTCTGSPSVCQ